MKTVDAVLLNAGAMGLEGRDWKGTLPFHILSQHATGSGRVHCHPWEDVLMVMRLGRGCGLEWG